MELNEVLALLTIIDWWDRVYYVSDFMGSL